MKTRDSFIGFRNRNGQPVQFSTKQYLMSTTIDITLQISQFSIRNDPSVEILNLVAFMTVNLKVVSPSLQARCSQCLGDILHMWFNYEEADDVLKKAQDSSSESTISLVQLNAHKA
jgi:hypothetical protein